MTNTNNNQESSNLQSNLNLNREEQITVEALSKIFKRDEQKFINSIDLFSDTDLHFAKIFRCLSKMKKDKIIDALNSLECLLEFDNKAVRDTIEEDKLLDESI